MPTKAHSEAVVCCVGSTSGSSSGWEQIDVGDVTDAAHEVASFTNTQAAPHLLDQVATPHPEQTTCRAMVLHGHQQAWSSCFICMLNAAGAAAASDDDFLFVASHSSSPHEDAQSAASPLGDTASQTPPTVPEKSLPASSIDQAMTGAAAMTAGIAETSLESSALLADQQVAAISDEDAAAATSAPEHVQVPASFPGTLCTAVYRRCKRLSLVLAWHVSCALCQSFLRRDDRLLVFVLHLQHGQTQMLLDTRCLLCTNEHAFDTAPHMFPPFDIH